MHLPTCSSSLSATMPSPTRKDIDLNASVDEPAAVIEADKQLIVTESTERARQLFPLSHRTPARV